ncbi:MAG: 30S ribosomal protein S8 [Clostridia bacterium]|nr:30S ribosomal protein S8 [Clostridia bacterium]
MNLTDPIADMLTRIRNAVKAKHTTVDVPYSKVKNQISNILLNEGFIADAEIVENGVNKNIRITLKYKDSKSVIQGLKRISKPGLRIYAEKEELPRVLNGLGIAIISTSKGIVTDKEARKLNVGGEVMAYVW